MTAGDNDATTLCHPAALTEDRCGVLVARPRISARPSGLSGLGEQLVQVRGADGLNQVSLDPHLAREFATGVLTAKHSALSNAA